MVEVIQNLIFLFQNRTDGSESPILEHGIGVDSGQPHQIVKYGELVILGYVSWSNFYFLTKSFKILQTYNKLSMKISNKENN